MSPVSNLNIECLENTESYGRYEILPLERGAGTTLGNALRRVLMSALTGAAINWVRVEGVEHEFSTIPHMKEDVLQFLLNLKAVRLRSLDSLPGRLVLEVQGEKEIHASDISPSTHFEIANPELYLATLDSPEAKLFVELNVELGKGYVPAGSNQGLPLGSLPLDAIYTPVRRVNYTVETVRMGEESTLEKLTFEVWTDVTIPPAVAVSQGANTLIEYFSIFRDASRLYPQEAAKPPLHLTLPLDQYGRPLDELGFSSRTLNALKRGGITTLGQLLERSQEATLSLRGLGEKSHQEIGDTLASLGFTTPSTQAKQKESSKETGTETPQAEAELGPEA